MAFLVGGLATLGPVLLVLGGTALIARRRFRSAAGSFRCRVRMPTGGRRRRWHRWPLRQARARWIHDVLIVQPGPLGLSVVPLAARIAPGAVLRPLAAGQVRGLGARPWALLLTTEDRAAVDVVVAEADRDLLVGPYLIAALDGLPSAPREQGA